MKKKSYSNSFRVLASRSHAKAFRRVSRSLPSGGEKTKQARTSLTLLEQPLPTSLLPMIGRKQEIAAICALLQQPEVRLLTLIGPGGVGKTRLALQIPTEVSSAFPDGLCFVSLIPVFTADIVLSTIAQALGLTERPNYSHLALVQEAMREKRFLLILDNFEHVALAAPQLKELLAACPQLKILVTSRIVLGLLEEQEFYVHPLALPDLTHLLPYEDLSQVAAVSLFLQRVRTVRPDFELTNSNALSIAQICVCLDGLPLALELAAARMKLFSPQGLLTRLDRRLSLLTSGPRDAPERQQTLRKTIEWSYDLLTREEQRLFRRLSVFVGGCSLQAIEAVSADMKDAQEGPILDVITSLLNQSLLQSSPQPSNQEQRFIMLETIREYALERLQLSEEEETTRQIHAEYYLGLARTLEVKVMGDESPHWIVWIENEFENLRAAFGWFLFSQDAERVLEMSGSLWAFWLQNSTLEGCHWINQALECCQRSVTEVQENTRAMAIHTASMLEYYRGNWQQADTLAEESLQVFRSTENAPGIARVLITQSIGALLQGHYAVAGTVAHESLRTRQKALSPWLSAEALLVQSYSSYFQSDAFQAYTIGKRAFTFSRQTGELYIMIRAAHAYALFADTQKKAIEVQSMYEEVMEITRTTLETGIFSPVAVCLIGLGAIAAIQKQYAWAVSLWGKAKMLYRRRDGLSELEPHRWLVVILGTHLLYSQVVEKVYAQLGDQAFRAAWQDGQSMALEQLLEKPKPTHTPAHSSSEKGTMSYSDELTTREKEVLCLLAQGLSSALIAKKLIISLVTVNTHIRAIYSKLGVSSRSAATRFAIEHNLV
jgi:predicted ATPase/DNA-binding CsgD family transcriptional regulator